jgi:hypothetical protein
LSKDSEITQKLAMSNLSTQETADLTKFFRLTIGSEMSQIEIDEALEYVASASTNPEYGYLLEQQHHPDVLKSLLRTTAVVDWLDDEGLLVKSDKIDEFHDRVSDLFDDALPPFSTWWDNSADRTHTDYYAWLDQIVSELGDKAHGGYELLSLDPGRDDNQHAIAVERSDTDRILLLGRGLSIRIDRLKNRSELWWWM